MAKAKNSGSRKGIEVTVRAWKNHPDYQWRADFVEGGKYRRKGFKTRAAAEQWAREREKETLAHGTDAALTAAERAAVLETRHLLENLGVSLRDAIQFAADFMETEENFITVESLLANMIKSRQRVGRSLRHLKDMKSKLGKFSAVFGPRFIASISKAEIEDWLHDLKLAPASFNSYRRLVGMLFREAEREGIIKSNPVAKISSARIHESKYSILTPAETEHLLKSARPEILPAIAIAAFTGLRDAEVQRLDWAAIRRQPDPPHRPHGHIWFQGEGAKTRKNRIIPLSENLAAWLAPVKKKEGPVWPENGRKLHEAARLAAGFAAPSVVARARKENPKSSLRIWPNNALRHSFASYWLALHQDAPALALTMGTSPDMIFRNYLALVTADDAAKYFSIFPTAGREASPLS